MSDDSDDLLGPIALPPSGSGARLRRRRAQADAETPGTAEAAGALEAPRAEPAPTPPSPREVAATLLAHLDPEPQPEPEPPPTGGRAGWLEGRRFVAVFVALVLCIPLLSWLGYSKVLHTTSGRKVDPIDSPTQPGYEANVAPTPVQLVGELDTAGALAGVVVISLPSGASGGSILFAPAGTTTSVGTTLAAAYAADSIVGLQRAAAAVLRTGFDGVAVIDPRRWAELLAPIGSLTITNPDSLPATKLAPAFPAGALTLAPDDVASYLAARRSGESDLNRLARQQLVWDAWLRAAEAKGAASIPGEVTAGLGRFLAALAAGPRTFGALPVTATAAGADTFTVEPGAAPQVLAAAIPYPTSDLPGDRIRVRVLDGVGIPGLAQAAARLLVPAGAEIAIVGNGEHFGQASTEVHGTGTRTDAAQAMQAALGVGSVVATAVVDDVVDVTVVLGDDFAAKVGMQRPAGGTESSGGGSSG